MDHKVFRECVVLVRKRYLKGSKREKGAILSEWCATWELNRSYASRLLSSLRKQELAANIVGVTIVQSSRSKRSTSYS